METYSGTSNLSANWGANTINLHWYADENATTELTGSGIPTSCVYDGTLTPPPVSSVPQRTGYTFAGWRVRGLPDGYTKLQYIQSSGIECIDTGIKLASTDVIEVELKNTASSSYGAFYGVYAVGQSSAFYGNQTYYGYDSANNKIDMGVAVDTNWHSVKHDFVNGILSLDNTVRNFTPFTFSNTVNNYLFTRYYNGSYGYYLSGAIRKYKVIRNGILIQNLVPARRNSDNAVGMYDIVNKSFLVNACTGAFTGPVAQ